MTEVQRAPGAVRGRGTHPAPEFGVLRLPDQVTFGAGSLASLPAEVAALGRRALICADPFIAGTDRFGAAVDALRERGVHVLVDTGAAPELPVAGVQQAAARARAQHPDVVVGVGGGSALDLAKLVALLLRHPAPLSSFYGENKVPGPVTPLVAVPTTAGTGSEVTPVAVVTDPARELKVGISSRFLVPRVAIVDPDLTLGAPSSVAAFAGIDAFVHAVEAFTAARRAPDWLATQPIFVGRNDLSSLLALEAVRVIAGALRTAVDDPDDVPSHTAMSYGSMIAGMAFGSAGTHFSHALQYPVGALTHTPHGLGTGMLLPHVLRICSYATARELALIGAAMGVDVTAAQDPVEATLEAVSALVHDVGVPVGLAEIGLTAHDLDRVATLALGAARLADNGPVPASQETFRRILDSAFDSTHEDHRGDQQ